MQFHAKREHPGRRRFRLAFFRILVRYPAVIFGVSRRR